MRYDLTKLKPEQECSCDCLPIGKGVHYRLKYDAKVVVCVRGNCRCIFRPLETSLDSYPYWPDDERAEAKRIGLTTCVECYPKEDA